ncbi:outer membrane-specific lipoprotein transporter subunit LolE [Catenovulum agarivorans DS-2]|uniref:Outer membrane-specific lipoprotein transporter subunit LolE n=1 Tax=Catenovulum agarivorans DS-2 TaxID=1328313 RepID=W7QET9_9ALTE|nr:lipoprotein-releasing ABC transporter permease subunit LolE [Catenovulum agarivorans]EWH11409.1 outer membrane-specific lipoprotein transporter subunit LolE [Catenovulum agarivorans DS-2]
MYSSLAKFIGFRYARSRKQNGFIRFISASSVVGIALGTCVLIWVLSVMNGFERELKQRLLSVIPHIEYTSVEASGIDDWQSLKTQIMQSSDEVEGVAPFITLGALIQNGAELKPVEIRGIDWQAELSVSSLSQYVTDDVQNAFRQQNGLLLGQGLANELSLEVGDWVEILVPQLDSGSRIKPPKLTRLPLIGVFQSNGQLDHLLGYVQLNQAAEMSGWQNGVQGVRLKVDDVFNAPRIARQIGFTLPVYVYIQDWTHQFGHIYHDIQLVRSVMYIVLTLVIAVACFNIVSTLVMAVNEKRGDIAIYKTMGMRNQQIVQIFVFQGILSGVTGTLIGSAVGVVGGLYLGNIFAFIEQLIGSKFLSGDIYFIDFLPTELVWSDVALTIGVALLLSIISTIYPAVKASKVEPAKVVGHFS